VVHREISELAIAADIIDSRDSRDCACHGSTTKGTKNTEACAFDSASLLREPPSAAARFARRRVERDFVILVNIETFVIFVASWFAFDK
jgi:hypothetical protein